MSEITGAETVTMGLGCVFTGGVLEALAAIAGLSMGLLPIGLLSVGLVVVGAGFYEKFVLKK